MKHNVLLALTLALLAACMPLQSPTLTPSPQQALPAARGVGVCHWIAPGGLPDELSWGTETDTPVQWKVIEPEMGVYDFGPLDEYMAKRQGDGVKVWLSIQTVGGDLNGDPKAPQWVIDQGAVWHTGTCSRGGMFAAWDAIYLDRLEMMLQAVNAHIMAQDGGYRATIGGIVMMSGGLYGEMQLSSCNMDEALATYYSLTPAELSALHGQYVQRLIDLYMAAFPEWPIMLQVGFCVNESQAAAEVTVIEYGLGTYGRRLLLKWAGLDPGGAGNEYYATLFKNYADRTQVGFEPGHAWLYQTPPGSGCWDPDKFQQMFDVAIKSKASYMCVQAGEMLWAARTVPGWRAFDAALEANASGFVPVPTLSPLPTLLPLPSPTITSTPTATRAPTSTPTVTAMPTMTAMPTSTPTNTVIPTDTPTSTPTSNVLRLLCEIDPNTGDVRCWPIGNQYEQLLPRIR